MLQRILKESTVYGLAGAASRFIGILLLPFYTRILTPDEFGLLDILIAISGAVVLISGLQVESGFGRSYFEALKRGEKIDIVGTAVRIYTFGGLAGGGLLLLLYWAANDRFPSIGWLHLLPMALHIIPSQILSISQMILRLDRKPTFFVVLSIGDVLTSGLLALLAIGYFHFGVAGFLWALFLSKVLWCAIAARFLDEISSFSWKATYAREILAFGIPLIPSVMVSWVQSYGNRFILLAFLSMFEVGVFGLAVRVASAAELLLMAFRLAWYPYAYETMGKPGFEAGYARMLRYFWLLGAPLCALTGAGGDLIVRIFAAAEYGAAGRVVGFLAMGLLWTYAGEILGLGIAYVRKTYLGLIGVATGAAVNLATLYLTVSAWGMLAAGASYLAGSMATALAVLALSQRQLHVPYSYRSVLVTALLSVAVSCWVFFNPGPTESLAGVIEHTLLQCALIGGVCAAVYLPMIPRQDRAELRAQVWRILG